MEQYELSVVPPFRLDLTVWALRRRQKNLVDKWDGERYTRVLAIDDDILQISVEQQNKTKLRVFVASKKKIHSTKKDVASVLQKMLGININLDEFYALSRKDKTIRSLASQFNGVKPPRFPSVFEALINAISCQQISLDAGISVLNRLSQKYGKKFEDNSAFPQPIDLVDALENDLKSLGYSYQKARSIIALTKDIVEKRVDLESLEDLSNQEIFDYLIKIKGVGRWTAEYVLLRGLGRINVLPGDDVGAQRNLMEIMHLMTRPNYDEIKELTKRWFPYAGLIYFHLLLMKLQTKDFIKG